MKTKNRKILAWRVTVTLRQICLYKCANGSLWKKMAKYLSILYICICAYADSSHNLLRPELICSQKNCILITKLLSCPKIQMSFSIICIKCDVSCINCCHNVIRNFMNLHSTVQVCVRYLSNASLQCSIDNTFCSHSLSSDKCLGRVCYSGSKP